MDHESLKQLQLFSDIHVHYNIYKPFTDHTITINPYHCWKLNIRDIIKNNNIICIVDKKETGQYIQQYCERINKTVLFMSSGNVQDISEWLKYDCVIYTEAINVGVDFNFLHFDCFVGVYGLPMNPDSFV